MAADDREAPRDLTSTVVRGISLAGSGYLLAQVLNLATFIVLARLLQPAQFGEFAAATVLVSLSLLVTESGLASAVVQRRDRLEAAAATAVVATAISGNQHVAAGARCRPTDRRLLPQQRDHRACGRFLAGRFFCGRSPPRPTHCSSVGSRSFGGS